MNSLTTSVISGVFDQTAEITSKHTATNTAAELGRLQMREIAAVRFHGIVITDNNQSKTYEIRCGRGQLEHT